MYAFINSSIYNNMKVYSILTGSKLYDLVSKRWYNIIKYVNIMKTVFFCIHFFLTCDRMNYVLNLILIPFITYDGKLFYFLSNPNSNKPDKCLHILFHKSPSKYVEICIIKSMKPITNYIANTRLQNIFAIHILKNFRYIMPWIDFK